MVSNPNRPFSPEEFRRLYSRVPRISVDLVIAKGDAVILVERALASYKGQWHLPGGTLLFKETVRDAAIRIAGDEVGLRVQPKELLGYIEYHSEEKERGYGYTIGLVMNCEWLEGTPRISDEGSDVKLFSELPVKMLVEQRSFFQSRNMFTGAKASSKLEA